MSVAFGYSMRSSPVSLLVPESLAVEIERQAVLSPTPVTLRDLYEYARLGDEASLIRGSRFLKHEMPIRLAKKVKELEESIPPALARVRWIQLVRDWYIHSFREIVDFPPIRTIEDDRRFCGVISSIKDRHKNQVSVMARGVQEWMLREGLTDVPPGVQAFLDSFFLSRIGIRVLLGHHAAVHDNLDGWVGVICAQTSPMEVAQQAAENAGIICRRTHGDPPAVRFHGKMSLKFRYLPSHLHHIFFELFKNSFRATIEHQRHHGGRMTPVHVVLAGGMEDVSIKITDQGGGIPRSSVERVWNYAYTTAQASDSTESGRDVDQLAGLGYGLPLCRLYARYFGGDMNLISLEGFGTDAYIYLTRIGTHEEYIL